ncbi:undecaprenyl-phosphate glucose phosphotransferase [Aliamphritea spongicola]|uniref:undecaprenyl-phosphate glucose phosphotransferase n=1 Tax=Aliamphritea spongicola TaxID=707589 RepID=UPI00196A5D33|nr:undecaprenyl-phosphate glucose phosphotransferase [Aliamphritea spongicola]MBN3560946.1 undecaprenyl-phosphate glucose phosphotransferase [Aliamphritea spongicola]
MTAHINTIQVSRSHARKKRLLSNHRSLAHWVQILADLCVIVASLLFLTYLKHSAISSEYRVLATVSVLLMFIVYPTQGLYRRSGGHLNNLMRLGVAWGLVCLLLALAGFVTKTSEMFSREVLLQWAVVAYLLQGINHIVLRTLYKHYKVMFAREIPTLVVGTGDLAKHLVNNLNSNNWLPDRVSGFVFVNDKPRDSEIQEAFSLPILGHVDELRQIIKQQNIRRVYIALPVKSSETIEALHIDLLDMNVDVIWVPDIFAMSLLNHSVREVAGMPLISLNESPMTSSKTSIFMKGVMDRSIALISLILLSPVFMAVAIAVKRSSPGPVFFKQERHGWDGKVIKVWKFRSMKLHEDAEVKQATKGDSRITKVGAFIRRTSIDELPQLINVLQGTMSLVGPRPHAVAHNEYYSGKVDAYLARHRIKPGITGLAQISGCRGETETIDKMQKRVEFDLSYINNWSLMGDIKILIKTPLSLLSKDIY